MLTLAFAARRAAMKRSALPRNGSVRSAVSVLVGNRFTQAAPLSSATWTVAEALLRPSGVWAVTVWSPGVSNRVVNVVPVLLAGVPPPLQLALVIGSVLKVTFWFWQAGDGLAVTAKLLLGISLPVTVASLTLPLP